MLSILHAIRIARTSAGEKNNLYFVPPLRSSRMSIVAMRAYGWEPRDERLPYGLSHGATCPP